jgi:hypothetical protein
MTIGSIYMIQKINSNPRNGNTVVPSSPKKYKTQKSSSMVLTSVFWNKDGVSLVNYVEYGAVIMGKYCVALPDKLKQQLISKH